MMETLHRIVTEINALPDYLGKGLMELLVLVVGGVIVAWITSTYFAQRAAESEVKGDIMKKKLDLYEAFVAKLDALQQMKVLPHNLIETAIIDIKSNNLPLPNVPQHPVADMFQSGDKLTEAVLDVDRFISVNRIYFEKGLYEKLQFFQIYIVVFNRLVVMFREHFVDNDIPLDNPYVKKYETMLAIELGLVFQDELSDEVEVVFDAIRESINNIKFGVQSKPDHSAKRLGSDGEIVQQLQGLKIMTERDKVKKLIAEQIAKGMFAVKNKSEKR